MNKVHGAIDPELCRSRQAGTAKYNSRALRLVMSAQADFYTTNIAMA